VAPDLLFHTALNEAEVLAGVSELEVIHPIAQHRGVMDHCNPNVFWELGVGFALGKPLILLANDEREFGLLADAAHCVLRSDDIGETRIRFDVALRDAMQLAALRTFGVLPARRPAMP